jgi:hypothetical protein
LLVYDLKSGRLVLCGAKEHDDVPILFRNAWSYDLATDEWVDLDDFSGPAARLYSAPAYDPRSNLMVVFGGHEGGGCYFDETSVFDIAANTWMQMHPEGDVPAERCSSLTAYDSSSGRVILRGGFGETASYSDLWAYEAATDTWTELHSTGEIPSSGVGDAMVYDSRSRRLILVGVSEETFVTWAYDSNANTWAELRPLGGTPPPRTGYAVVYDSRSGRIILFGGRHDTAYFSDLWAYDLLSRRWTDVTPLGPRPSARPDSLMVYDPMSRKVVLFGGRDRDGQFLSDMWEYWPAVQ